MHSRQSTCHGVSSSFSSSMMHHNHNNQHHNHHHHSLQLPESLDSVQKSDFLPNQRHRWNTNEEIASILIAFDKHEDWLKKEVKIRPKSGSMMLYSRKRVRYRRDGYCWKKRKDGKTTREDHMKLKVQGTECIYGCYVHSAILPTFHRRCYWLLQNPDIVLVHYLNVPYSDDNKVITPTLNCFSDSKKEWTKEELISELKPMFFSDNEPDLNNELELSTAETIEAIVQQLMLKQRARVKAFEDSQDSLAGISARALSTVTRQISDKNQNVDVSLSAPSPSSSTSVSSFRHHMRPGQVTSSKSTLGMTPSSKAQVGSHAPPVTTNSITLTGVTPAVTSSANVQLLPLDQTTSGVRSVQTQQQKQGVTPAHRNQTSLIFNLSQFQNGNGILILNSAVPSAAGSASINRSGHPTTSSSAASDPGQRNPASSTLSTPVTLVYSRPTGSKSSSSSSGGRETRRSGGPERSSSTSQPIHLKPIDSSRRHNLSGSRFVSSPGVNSICSAQRSASSSSPIESSPPPDNLVEMDVVNGNINSSEGTNGRSGNSSFGSHTRNNNNGNPTQHQHLKSENSPQQQTQHHPESPSIESEEDVCSDERRNGRLNIGFPEENQQQDLMITGAGHQQMMQSSLDTKSHLRQVSSSEYHQNSHHNHNSQGNSQRSPFTQPQAPSTPDSNFASGAFRFNNDTNGSGGCNSNYQQIRQHQNMSLENNNLDPDDMHPMDFIDNDISTPDEDLFNLETFEMLTEFPNLDDLNPHNNNSINSNGTSDSNMMIFSRNNTRDHLTSTDNNSMMNSSLLMSTSGSSDFRSNSNMNGSLNNSQLGHVMMTPQITDYSPEWSYPEGGMKVLVAGPWYSATLHYNIIFDGISVPTSLVQNGVLRCFSPPHEPGYISLQVSVDGSVVSNSVIFEYREHPATPSPCPVEDYFSVDDNVFKFCLLERLELLETHVSGSSQRDQHEMCTRIRNFEDRLISMCSHVMSSPWLPCNVTSVTSQSLRSGSSRTDMSLLHLASALGYSKLIEHLIKWRVENPSIILEVEVDAFSCDKNECTPLMWSLARGHRASSIILLKWNKGAINLCNRQGKSPLHVARKKGFDSLVEEIEKLQKELTLSASTDSHADSLLTSSSSPSLASSASFTDSSAATDSLSDHQKPVPLVNNSSKVCSNNTSGCPVHNPLMHNHLNHSQQHQQVNCDHGFVMTGANRKSSLCASRSSVPTCNQKRYYFCSGHFHEAPPPSTRIFTRKSSSCDTGVELGFSSDDDDVDDDNDCDGISGCGLTGAGGSKGGCGGSCFSSQRSSFANCDGECDMDSFMDSSNSERVLTIAEQIIAAIPDRIKSSSDQDEADYHSQRHSSNSKSDAENAGDIEGETGPHQIPSFPVDFLSYRYGDGTPTSSPASSSCCLQSPGSIHNQESPSPPPTAADLCEFFHASDRIMQKEFSSLTLSDQEQRELYEAAKTIQKAYRVYKGRKRQEQEKERQAAVLIQSYYRRYKQYVYYKQMTRAAQVIQNQFRNYCSKRFKKSNTNSPNIRSSSISASSSERKMSRGSSSSSSSAGVSVASAAVANQIIMTSSFFNMSDGKMGSSGTCSDGIPPFNGLK